MTPPQYKHGRKIWEAITFYASWLNQYLLMSCTAHNIRFQVTSFNQLINVIIKVWLDSNTKASNIIFSFQLLIHIPLGCCFVKFIYPSSLWKHIVVFCLETLSSNSLLQRHTSIKLIIPSSYSDTALFHAIRSLLMSKC